MRLLCAHLRRLGALIASNVSGLLCCAADVSPTPHPTVQLGTTLDDALGEAYDKVARLLGLELKPSGGAALERFAAGGDPRAIPLSVPMQVGARRAGRPRAAGVVVGCGAGRGVASPWPCPRPLTGFIWCAVRGLARLTMRCPGTTLNPHALLFLQRRPTCDFSFAGLKTAVRLAIEARLGEAGPTEENRQVWGKCL